MKNILFIFLTFLNIIGWAQTLNPSPQTFIEKGNFINPTHFQVKTNNPISTLPLLKKIFAQKEGKKITTNVYIGTKNEAFAKKFLSKVPQKPEGYYLSIDEKNIYVIGNDERGAYYGVRTLEQLLSAEKLPVCEIIDFPDLASRGVVEGFYGTPWSHEKRLRQLDFYGKFKLNTYIYGPKDDPYHSSPNWRLPYPEKEALQIKELVQRSNENYVDFVWAIHPGKDIKWNEEDRKNLLNKFQMMYDLGVRAFAVFFDDISGEGTNPQKQAELLNFLHDEFVAKRKGVKPLIMCPTEYNKSWSNPEKKYLQTLGTMLHPSVEIMWTGNRVVADIDKSSMEWINAQISRKAYIWWNFPVSDYVRDRILLGAAYGNTSDVKNDISGFVSNPMEHPEASKIAIYGVADYTWNLEKYQPEIAWKKAIIELMPQNKEALQIFASHNSDLGANGHQYRRVESVDFKPIADNFLKKIDTATPDEIKNVTKEFTQMVWVANVLLNTTENKYLTEELEPWLLQFGLAGQRGVAIMEMYQALRQKDYDKFKNLYETVSMLQRFMYENDQNYNQNPYQPGMKTATLVVEPFLNEILAKSVNHYNQATNSQLRLALNFNPNTLQTNVKQLETQPLLQRGKSVRISPVLEYISLKNNDLIGIELDKVANIKTIFIDFGNAEHIGKGKVQVSDNGMDWKSIEGNFRNTRWQNKEALKSIKYVRFLNDSGNSYEIQLKQFEVVTE